jgi:hypothetical protein
MRGDVETDDDAFQLGPRCGVPSMIAANVRGGMNASGARRRMCLSTLPSRAAISANDRTQPDATSSIQARALAMARRMRVSEVVALNVSDVDSD